MSRVRPSYEYLRRRRQNPGREKSESLFYLAQDHTTTDRHDSKHLIANLECAANATSSTSLDDDSTEVLLWNCRFPRHDARHLAHCLVPDWIESGRLYSHCNLVCRRSNGRGIVVLELEHGRRVSRLAVDPGSHVLWMLRVWSCCCHAGDRLVCASKNQDRRNPLRSGMEGPCAAHEVNATS